MTNFVKKQKNKIQTIDQLNNFVIDKVVDLLSIVTDLGDIKVNFMV